MTGSRTGSLSASPPSWSASRRLLHMPTAMACRPAVRSLLLGPLPSAIRVDRDTLLRARVSCKPLYVQIGLLMTTLL